MYSQNYWDDARINIVALLLNLAIKCPTRENANWKDSSKSR